MGEEGARAFASGPGWPRPTTSVDSHCSMSSMRQAWVTGIWKEGKRLKQERQCRVTSPSPHQGLPATWPGVVTNP